MIKCSSNIDVEPTKETKNKLLVPGVLVKDGIKEKGFVTALESGYWNFNDESAMYLEKGSSIEVTFVYASKYKRWELTSIHTDTYIPPPPKRSTRLWNWLLRKDLIPKAKAEYAEASTD